MQLRFALLSFGILAAYLWRRRWRLTHDGLRTTELTNRAALLFSGAIVLFAWTLWRVFQWGAFWDRSPLEILPLDASLVGMVIGVLLADQQAAAESLGRRAAAAEQPGTPLAGKALDAPKHFSETVLSMVDAWRGIAGSLSVLALLFMGIVPPRVWEGAVPRLHGIKAAGVEITLGTATGDKVAQAIPASPRDTSGRPGGSERHGFTAPRLERMRSLTHALVLDHAEPANTSMENNPTAYLFAEISKALPARPADIAPARVQIRDVQRDRAMLLHLYWGPRAVDTRPQRRSPPAAYASDKALVPNGPVQDLLRLGSAQEQVLARLAPHVACVYEIIDLTSDRRLLQYRSAGVVDELSLLARVWSSLERAHALRLMDPAAAPDDEARKETTRELMRHADGLRSSLHAFTVWALQTSNAWRQPGTPRKAAPPNGEAEPAPPALRHDTSTSGPLRRDVRRASLDQRRRADTAAGSAGGAAPRAEGGGGPIPNTRCGTALNAVGDVGTYIAEAEAAGSLLDGGFTPYLTMFAAQALSAMGDHAGALRLLYSWQQDLLGLIETAERRAAASGRGGTVPPPPQAKRPEIEGFLHTAAWHSLTAFTETLILQQLSENTDMALPPTEKGVRSLVGKIFPRVLSRVLQEPSLPEWRTGSRYNCHSPALSWRQPLVLSYATWIKEYLDIRNKNLIRPKDISAEDIELADLLGSLNLQCFPDELATTDAVDDQRAHFCITVTAIKLNQLVGGDLSAAQKEALHAALEAAVRRTLDDLERLQGEKKPAESLEQLIFERENLLLSSAKRIKVRLDELSTR